MSDSEAKRTEYQRAQMSLGERVEVLERAVDRLRANKATLDWAEGIDRAMANLLGRVAEIEKGKDPLTGLRPGQMALDAEIEWTTRAELARLRRVEAAARALQDGSDRYEFLATPRMTMKLRWDALRAALDSEPE